MKVQDLVTAIMVTMHTITVVATGIIMELPHNHIVEIMLNHLQGYQVLIKIIMVYQKTLIVILMLHIINILPRTIIMPTIIIILRSHIIQKEAGIHITKQDLST